MAVSIDLSNVLNGGGPLVKLEASPTYNISKFPDDIADTPYFIVFRSVNNFNVGNFLGKNIFKKTPIVGNVLKFGKVGFQASLPNKGFALPIPSNLVTSYNARYANEGLGPIGDIGRRIGQGVESPSGFNASAIQESITNAVSQANLQADDLTGSAGSLAIGAVEGGAAAAAIASKLLGGGNLGAAGAAGLTQGLRGALVGAGIARNPHLATVFTGVDFKTHQFSYKLIAKNKSESDTLRNMIRSFKYAMAPQYAVGDHIFRYPNQFDITLAAGEYLFKFGRSVLTQFDVNYNGEGTPAFFEESGAPYSVTLNMSFQETSIVTKREIGQGR